MNARRDDDIDRRFNELIRDEYGTDAQLSKGPIEDDRSGAWFSLEKAIDDTEPDPLRPEERWRPAGSSIHLGKRGWISVGCFGLCLLMSLLMTLDVMPHQWWPATMLAFGAGLAVLLSMIPKHHDGDDVQL